MEVAEEHFRRIGYAKTAVNDIAHALGMSGANVYRFFASKGAINDAICRRLLDACIAMAEEIAARPAPASERLTALIMECYHFCKTRLTDEHRIHDMVTVAMQESWPAIEAFKLRLRELHHAVIRDGVESGEFAPTDLDVAAETVCAASVAVHHPVLIAECAGSDLEATARNLAALIVRGLRA